MGKFLVSEKIKQADFKANSSYFSIAARIAGDKEGAGVLTVARY